MKNDVTFEGKVVSEPKFSHKSGKNVYYSFLLSCKRKSGVEDIIPVRMLKKNLEKLPIIIGNYIRVRGRLQSYNSQDPENFGKRLVYINALDAELCKKKNIKNDTTLEGIVCKTPTYRVTPKGKNICDLVLKNCSDDDKSAYYIPCICWFGNALKASLYDIGTKIIVRGRIQSREYVKFDEDNNKSFHTTYELSVSDIKKD